MNSWVANAQSRSCEQLVDRVVVAVAEVAVVELVRAAPRSSGCRGRRTRTGSPRPRACTSFERHRPAREHAPARRLAHLLAPAVVRARHRGLELGVDAVEPHVVLGPVDHHHVDALDARCASATRSPVKPSSTMLAVLGDHVLGGPVDRLLEVAVDRRRGAGCSGRRRSPGCSGRSPGGGSPPDAVAVARVEEPRPEVRRVHTWASASKTLNPLRIGCLPRSADWTIEADATKRALGWSR